MMFYVETIYYSKTDVLIMLSESQIVGFDYSEDY